MDFESNCGDADDELQMFENTPKTKSACDAPKPGGPLTTRQPTEYSWMSGNLLDTHENRAESPLYGELYQDTSHVLTSIT